MFPMSPLNRSGMKPANNWRSFGVRRGFIVSDAMVAVAVSDMDGGREGAGREGRA